MKNPDHHHGLAMYAEPTALVAEGLKSLQIAARLNEIHGTHFSKIRGHFQMRQCWVPAPATGTAARITRPEKPAVFGARRGAGDDRHGSLVRA